jgi:hypothetical protein
MTALMAAQTRNVPEGVVHSLPIFRCDFTGDTRGRHSNLLPLSMLVAVMSSAIG